MTTRSKCPGHSTDGPEVQRTLGRIEATQTAILEKLDAVEKRVYDEGLRTNERISQTEQKLNYASGALLILTLFGSHILQWVTSKFS